MRRIKLDYRDKILCGDTLEVLKSMEAGIVDMCITSPPYWGLRDYGTAQWEGGDNGCDHIKEYARANESLKNSTLGPLKKGLGANNAAHIAQEKQYGKTCLKCGAIRIDKQLGLEPTIDEYISNMTAVFEEVKRVLKDTGVLFLNMGDAYASANSCRIIDGNGRAGLSYNSTPPHKRSNRLASNIKEKDLIGQPWRLAFSLQAAGWYLRSDIIWHKPNPMPESVTDRPTKSHEYLFLLTKKSKYFYDADAVREEHKEISIKRSHRKWDGNRDIGPIKPSWSTLKAENMCHPAGRNKRTVWTIATQAYSGAHFATFPEKLVEPCIRAGTSEKGNCAECGKPWVRVVEKGYKKHDKWFGGKQDARHSRGAAGNSYNEPIALKTLGWKPSCSCGADTVQPIILDPFFGSGTVGLVAKKLNRDYLGIELNPEYIKLAEKRIRDRMGLFVKK